MDLQSQSLDHEVLKATSSDPRDKIASRGKRFLNMILDTVFYYVIIIIVAVIMGAFGLEEAFTNPVQLYAIIIIVYFAYYAGMEATLGKTIGKIITKTTVVTKTGEKISWGKAFGRTASRIIPFEAFTFLSVQPVGLHDSISGTIVINDN